MPSAISVQNVQPPLGVEIVHVTSVILTMELSSSSEQKSRATRGTRDMDLRALRPVTDQPEDMEFPMADDVQTATMQEQAMLLDSIRGTMADAPFPTGDELLHMNPPTAIPQRIDSGTASADDQLSKGNAEQHELRQPILELIDSTLRTAICEKPPRLPSGVKITRDDVTKLAAVFPALWRPNYLKLVSERAPFLPTIAHALSRSLPSNARSASLKRKAAGLPGRYLPGAARPGPSSPADVQLCKGADSVYEAASIGLWNLLQRSHFDAGTGGRLKPLVIHPSNIATGGLREADEMLFEISEWQGGSDPFAGLDDSGNSHNPSPDQLPEHGLLWECDSEYVEKDRSSLFETMEVPLENNDILPVFDESYTDEQMLLDTGDVVELVRGVASGTVPDAHSLPARSRHQVSTACERDTMGETLLLENAERTETPTPADAYDCVLAEPEMLFDADI
ncbi:bel1-like homeodomain protein 8 [Diplodia corticola]|uniref:Bel1-like homeodomain protein 8 n=1 Tax=Diplodia corticola TaxID=236234 RepID=A0A1J9QX79_9PEZI|nr:bel1-like homeodomain protein 8 [Diplodia corticola]OJD33622.1 bel1-like homeodomain protein 8 [Diplodia corticola]